MSTKPTTPADARRFPIHSQDRRLIEGCPKSIPWSAIEPHREQAMKNHSQTLERLAERGGLGLDELYAVMHSLTYRAVRDASGVEALAFAQSLNAPTPPAVEPDALRLPWRLEPSVGGIHGVLNCRNERVCLTGARTLDAVMHIVTAANAYSAHVAEIATLRKVRDAAEKLFDDEVMFLSSDNYDAYKAAVRAFDKEFPNDKT